MAKYRLKKKEPTSKSGTNSTHVVGSGNTVVTLGDISNVNGQVAIGSNITQKQPGQIGKPQVAIGKEIVQVDGDNQTRVMKRKRRK